MTGVLVGGMGEAFDRRYESLVHTTLRPARETYALFVSRPLLWRETVKDHAMLVITSDATAMFDGCHDRGTPNCVQLRHQYPHADHREAYESVHKRVHSPHEMPQKDR